MRPLDELLSGGSYAESKLIFANISAKSMPKSKLFHGVKISRVYRCYQFMNKSEFNNLFLQSLQIV